MYPSERDGNRTCTQIAEDENFSWNAKPFIDYVAEAFLECDHITKLLMKPKR